jgi:hypothetical protein
VATVYSKLLAGRNDPVAGDTLLGTPPAGHKWVIKDIAVFNNTPPGGDINGFYVHDTVGLIIFARLFPFVALSGYYEWHGGQVIEEADAIYFNTPDYISWSVRISGYELLLP